jgi:uncharacterized protein (TIGR02118 family)
MVKQMFAVKRKKGMNFDEFKKYYLEVHAPLVKKSFPQIRKYVISFVLQRGKETPYDAITSIYWDDVETIVKASKSDTFQKVIMPDEDKAFDRESGIVLLSEEYTQK